MKYLQHKQLGYRQEELNNWSETETLRVYLRKSVDKKDSVVVMSKLLNFKFVWMAIILSPFSLSILLFARVYLDFRLSRDSDSFNYKFRLRLKTGSGFITKVVSALTSLVSNTAEN